MDPNPYKPPVAIDQPLLDSVGPIRAQGKYLIVFNGAVLPQRCVRTNQKITEADMRRKTYDWCSPWVVLTVLISVCITIILYLVLRKRCEITFGLHESVRRKYRNWLIFKLLAVVGLFCAMPLAAATDSGGLIAAVVILFFVALIALLVGNSPLRVTNHSQGEFWIKGCCQEFLDDLAASQADSNPFGGKPYPAKPIGEY